MSREINYEGLNDRVGEVCFQLQTKSPFSTNLNGACSNSVTHPQTPFHDRGNSALNLLMTHS